MNAIKHAYFYLKDFVSLQQAMEHNNATKTSEAAWVYDRFQAATCDCTDMDAAAVSVAFNKYLESLPGEHDKPVLDLFRMVPVDTFDSNEQIDWLIKEGKFYYAPLV